MILTKAYLSGQAEKRNIFEFSEQRIINENAQLIEKSISKKYDIFLSHSSLDKKLVLALIDLFHECGYTVYVDWINDTQLDRSNVNKDTANTLRVRMKQSTGLSFLTTSNSLKSDWCPWELGYFDGLKNSRCCILPVLEYSTTSFKGQEYLGLYPYLEYEKYQNSDKYEFWVTDTNGIDYVKLRDWLNGTEPFKH